MNQSLRLVISTPAKVLVDDPAVRSVVAEDDSGSFGIQQGHTGLLTVTRDCVVRWESNNGGTHYCAIRSGVLMVTNNALVRIACREGVCGDDLDQLQQHVHQYRLDSVDKSREQNVRQLRLHTVAMRQIMSYLSPGSTVPLEHLDLERLNRS